MTKPINELTDRELQDITEQSLSTDDLKRVSEACAELLIRKNKLLICQKSQGMKMSNYKQVLQWLLDGKKIRDKEWLSNGYIYIHENAFYDEKGILLDEIHLVDICNKEWKLYVEKKHFCSDGPMNQFFCSSNANGEFIANFLGTPRHVSYCPFCGEESP